MKIRFAESIAAPLCVVAFIAVAPASASDSIDDARKNRTDEMIMNPQKAREAYRAEHLEELRHEYDGWSRDELLEEILDLREELDELRREASRAEERRLIEEERGERPSRYD